MENIEAIIRPFKLEEVKAILNENGIHGATVSEVWVHNGKHDNAVVYRGAPYREGYLPRIKLELVVPDEQKSGAIAAILRAAKTGNFGDGMIFVSPVVDAIRIRTGEHGINTVSDTVSNAV